MKVVVITGNESVKKIDLACEMRDNGDYYILDSELHSSKKIKEVLTHENFGLDVILCCTKCELKKYIKYLEVFKIIDLD